MYNPLLSPHTTVLNKPPNEPNSIIIPIPPLSLPSMPLPIQPTTIINPNISRIISSLHSHLRRRHSPYTSLAIEDHLRRFSLALHRIGLSESEPRLELIWGEIPCISL